VQSVDDLAIEIGLAAWVSLSAPNQVLPARPGGVEALADAGQRGAQGAWSRTQELARRILLGGAEPSSAVAAGGAARTAGVCGAAAVACLAGGVVGPGIGGVADLGGGHRQATAAKVRGAEQSMGEAPVAVPVQAEPEEPAEPQGREPAAPSGGGGAAPIGESKPRSAETQTETEFGLPEARSSTAAVSTQTPRPPPPAKSELPGKPAPATAEDKKVEAEFGVSE
jgi:hypothetical protein